MKVWTRTETPQTLLNQRLWGFSCNVVYTVFYAKVYEPSYNKSFKDFLKNVASALYE